MALIMDLGRACGRVGVEYREVARWKGDREFHVHVEIVGLGRHESAQMYGAVLAHERVEKVSDPVLDPDLEREKRSRLSVDVVKVSNLAAACSIVLDAVRAALVDTGLAAKVEALKVEGGGT